MDLGIDVWVDIHRSRWICLSIDMNILAHKFFKKSHKAIFPLVLANVLSHFYSLFLSFFF